MSAESYNVLLAWLEDIFPSTAAEFDLSFPSTLLQELSFYCGSLQDPALDHCQRTMKLARPVLSALATICSLEDLEEKPESPQDTRKPRRVSQKQAKKAKRAERRLNIDEGPFIRLGASVPASKEDALTLSQDTLKAQYAILTTYLEVLRKPELAEHIHSCYMPIIAPPEESSILADTQDPAEIETTFTTIEVEPDLPSAYPAVQPLRAALYFDSPNGFGLWRLIMPQRAEKDLRDARKKDPKLFDIIIKKLKELSHGHFSADNQKRLVGSDNGLPIFEAKMTGDTRLVYRVDCEQEYGSDVSTLLRIYGIYTHAQMHGRRFWDAVSRMGGGGKEHRKRCIYRSAPRTPGSNVIPPAMWPPPEDNEDEEDGLQLPDLSVEDKQELQNLLRSEKFVPFSQAFLNGTSCSFVGIISDKDVNHPFYMSAQEQAIVLHPGSCFVLGRSGTGKTTTMVFKMIGIERMWRSLEEGLTEATPRPRQLFVTQSRVLAEKVEEYFRKMMLAVDVEGQAMPLSPRVDTRSSGGIDFGMVDKDEEDRHRSVLPQKFSDLSDDNFPLFLTSDQLCRLLAADFNELVDAQKRVREGRPLKEDFDLSTQGDLRRVPHNVISYYTFLTLYWRRFPQGLTKGLEPSSVYAEFIGIIKGSERALCSADGILDRQSYCDTSERVAAFSGQRDNLYSLFEAYLKAKRRDGQADSADRTHTIIHNFLQYGVPGQRLFLRFICRRPDGVFWAGDTAQTISAGSSFRFNELKAFMYRLENGSKTSNSRTFQLTKNYRSHGGIVKCANAVVRLITKFWPYTIDFLEEEKGTIDGLKPTFFSGGSGEAPEFGEFLSDEGGCTIEFGAKQCVIVRDATTRDQLYSELGDVGIILTLYESKGLEFEDVVLYNFFADSTVGASQWRLVLSELSDSEGLAVKSPIFDEIKHHGLCRELKSLYVAITRARLNLWIIDYSNKGEPMRHKGQISTWVPGSPVPRLATTSSRAEWGTAAKSLFSNRNYMQAMYAYQRAGMTREKTIAEAYHLRAVAEQKAETSSLGDSEMVSAFVQAAHAFRTAADAADSPQLRRTYYRICAECFVTAGDDVSAAKFFEGAAEYDLSAKHYRKAGSFDDAVRLTKTYESEMEQTVLESIIDVSKLYYLKSGDIGKAQELFGSVEEVVDYTDLYGLDAARAALYESNCRYADAASAHLQSGNVDEAVRLFLRASTEDITNVRRACDCILDELWKTLPLDVELSSHNPRIRKLLDLSASLMQHELPSIERDQLTMFEAIVSGHQQNLIALGRKFSQLHPASTIRCLDHVFSAEAISSGFKSDDLAKTWSMLEAFSVYTRALRSMAYSHQSCDNPDLQRLLSFSVTVQGEQYQVHPGTLLAQELVRVGHAHVGVPETGIQVPRYIMPRVIRRFLQQRLLDRVRMENDACRSSSMWSQPCLNFAVDEHCPRDANQCQRPHILWDNLPAHSQQLSPLILTQMRIYEDASNVERWTERWDQHRWWLSRLYQTWQPWFGKLTTTLDPAVDNFVVGKWLYEAFFDHSLDPTIGFVPDGFLTGLLRYMMLHRIAMRTDSPPYAHRIPCITGPFPAWLRRHTDGVHITHDLLLFFNGHPRGIPICTRFLRHIMGWRLPIDGAVLCDFLDVISSALVVICRARTFSGVHNVVLPRRWLLSVAGLFLDGFTSQKEVGLIADYVKVVGFLLRRLYTGNDIGRLSTSEPLNTNFPPPLSCQNLSIVGHNIQNLDIKTEIHRMLRSLGTSDEAINPHWLYERLVAAVHWEQIADIVRNNSFELAIDDMIQLADRSRVANMPLPAGNLRRVVYDRPANIPSLLVSDESPVAVSPDDEVDGEATEDLDEAPAQFASYIEKELAIVRRATLIYLERTRRRLRMSAFGPPSALGLLRVRHFNEFLAQSAQMPWSGPLHTFYRKLYLGPVPHIMVALDCVLEYLHGRKRKETMRLGDKGGDHLELDAIQAEVKRWESLRPQSDIHREADRERLEQLVSEVRRFILAIPENPDRSWEDDLSIAVKGILVRKKAVASIQQRKPELQVEDDLDYSYMCD
ncbi:uncharacterized protein PHACADRAFT_167779 [Phanerochaete carnosa HHB-10118-sp]|uniref:UvrD-like helicase C-terminal domain-containing protein n=1 Tax=Phanerochaete carnosa (strain HHB-10118-sp) TaxID=650164 RepID=K5WLW9_PHACS|nr:uncharacterized protein PHACADRAFT_167779 [Phanerochaete carnosa HHB-10118-sp]EKM60415.1 hypothetical protein PHACADRAFT_167779 [Phanerochaete carnosa HHB-10118-sp]